MRTQAEENRWRTRRSGIVRLNVRRYGGCTLNGSVICSGRRSHRSVQSNGINSHLCGFTL